MAVKLSVIKRWVKKFVPMFEGDEEFKKSIEDALANVKEDGVYEIALIQRSAELQDALASKPVYAKAEKAFIKQIAKYIKKYKLLLEEDGKIKFRIRTYKDWGKNFVFLEAGTILGEQAYYNFKTTLVAQTMAKVLMNEKINIRDMDLGNYTQYIYIEV